MPYIVQNPNVFTAAFSGAVAGMGVSGRVIAQTDPIKYAGLVAIASAFAQELDTKWGVTSVGFLEVETIEESAEALWQERAPTVSATTLNPSTWTQECEAIIAIVDEALDLYSTSGFPNPPIASGAATPFVTDVFAGPGPSFLLSSIPIQPANILLFINGVRYTQEVGVWTLVGTTATWANVLFTLDGGDEVVFYYEVT